MEDEIKAQLKAEKKQNIRQKEGEEKSREKSERQGRNDIEKELRTKRESAGGEQVFQVVYQSPVKGH